jgi:hypothetical protein
MGASTVTALGVILLWLAHKSDRLSYSTLGLFLLRKEPKTSETDLG